MSQTPGEECWMEDGRIEEASQKHGAEGLKTVRLSKKVKGFSSCRQAINSCVIDRGSRLPSAFPTNQQRHHGYSKR